MLSPMPLAISMGVGASRAVPWTMPAVENINGQAITLLQVRRAVRLFHAQLPVALLPGRTRTGPRHRRADPFRAAARNGGQPARRQHRRRPGARPRQPARGL
ncbi:hypothetical protein G6F59_018544 [Rhizopus arrhizus]|nr:hypothetical protein G6F59_018544 [Rhizopus arrhizus]